MHHTATQCITLQHNALLSANHTATQCITLQHNASHCNTMHLTATQCITLQHNASHCNTMHHTATQCITLHECLPMGARCRITTHIVYDTHCLYVRDMVNMCDIAHVHVKQAYVRHVHMWHKCFICETHGAYAKDALCTCKPVICDLYAIQSYTMYTM